MRLLLTYSFFPLHRAAIRGFADVIQHLIKGGTDPNCVDYEGYTPLHLAAKSSHYDACEMLYRLGADPTRANNFVFSPLDFAKRYGFDDIIQLLSTPRSKLVSSMSSRGDAPKSVGSNRETQSAAREASVKDSASSHKEPSILSSNRK